MPGHRTGNVWTTSGWRTTRATTSPTGGIPSINRDTGIGEEGARGVVIGAGGRGGICFCFGNELSPTSIHSVRATTIRLLIETFEYSSNIDPRFECELDSIRIVLESFFNN